MFVIKCVNVNDRRKQTEMNYKLIPVKQSETKRRKESVGGEVERREE